MLASDVVKAFGRLLVRRIALLVPLVTKELMISNLPTAIPPLLA